MWSDPKVRFLREHMIDAGCPVWVRLLMPLNCKDQGFAGGYTSGKGVFFFFFFFFFYCILLTK